MTTRHEAPFNGSLLHFLINSNGPNNICNSKRGNKENNHNQEHKNQDAPSSLEHFFSDDQP